MQREIREEEVIRDFEKGLENREIYICYQPQYNHSTGRMIGAEALMRWKHPIYGPQFPAAFISIMEKHGLIHKADLYVFEEICRFIRKCIDQQISLIPVSFNISRHDLFGHDYVEEIEEIRKRYEVPVQYLRAA